MKKKIKTKKKEEKKAALKDKDGEKVTKKETYSFRSVHQKMWDLIV